MTRRYHIMYAGTLRRPYVGIGHERFSNGGLVIFSLGRAIYFRWWHD